MPQYMWVDWMIKLQNLSCGNFLSNQDQWVCISLHYYILYFYIKAIKFSFKFFQLMFICLKIG